MSHCIFCQLPLEGNNNYCNCESCSFCHQPFCVAFECLYRCIICSELLEDCNCIECEQCHSIFCTCDYEQQHQEQDEEPQQEDRNDRNNN
jgi:hypothetical protein